ncbi:MAG: lipopolysaccharide biosynthesis protein [Rikenellaceae bacterium]
MSNSSIKNSAIKGMAWTGVERLVCQAAQFVIGIIIARVLMPSDYGVIGMLAIFLAIAQSILDSGFANALIQKKERTNVDYCTVFYFNIAVSLLLYAVFFISAPYIAEFYNMPILESVARVVSLSMIINGLTIVQTAKLTIDLNFKLQSIISITSTLASGGVGIALAYSGYGVWALVFQGLASSTMRMLLLWSFSRWKPILTFSYSSFKQLFSFGSKLLCSGLINTIYNNIYTLIIGKFFSAANVGLYNRGNQFVSLPTDTITQTVLKVNYPILSNLQDDDEKLVATYRKLLRAPLFLLYPILFGLAALAKPVVLVLLGEQWLDCVPFIQILSLGYMWSPLTHINLNLLYVKGKSDKVLKLELIKKPIAFIILFATIPFGIWWMCAGRAIYFFIAFAMNCYYTKRLLNYGFTSQIKEVLPIIANVVVMFLAITLSISLVDSELAQLIVGILVGIISFVGLSLLTKDSSFYELLNIVKTRFKK